MGKNKNKPEPEALPVVDKIQPEVIQPEMDAELPADAIDEVPPVVETAKPIKAGKKSAAEKPAFDQSVIDSIVERNVYMVEFVVNHAPLKAGAVKKVSGNVAKVLIKKGLVKLKN